MSEITVISDGSATTEQSPAIVTEPTEKASEIIIDGATEIAQIEADRDIKIAEIQAETTIEVVEASIEKEELSEWQRNIEARMISLETENSELRSTLAQSIRQEPEPLNPQPQEESAVAMPESLAEPKEPAKAKRRTKFRLI